jgi:hypothetical protein
MRGMLRRLFRRQELSPEEVAERQRLNREAEKARYRAERDMAMQRGQIEGFFDRDHLGGGPAGGGAFGGP